MTERWPTSVRLSFDEAATLARICQRDGRSGAQEIRWLILERARTLGLDADADHA